MPERTGAGSTENRNRSISLLDDEIQPLRLVLKNVLLLLFSLMGVGLVTAILFLFDNTIALSLVPIAYLIPIIAAATRWGIWPATAASIASVGAADFFFFNPLYSFRIDDPQEAIDLLLFLVVALVSSNLASRLRRETEILRRREKEIHDLYEFSRRLAACFTVTDLICAIQNHLSHTLGQHATFLIATADGHFEQPEIGIVPKEVQEKVASMIATIDLPAHTILDESTHSVWLLRAVRSEATVHGVIAVNIGRGSRGAVSIKTRRVEAILEEASLTLQRLDIGRAMEDAKLHRQSQRLRDAFLGALSHELRSPLAAIQGSASVLNSTPLIQGDGRIHTLVEAISEEVSRLDGFIQNLLNATRITAGGISPRLVWTDPKDVINAAIELKARRLGSHKLSIEFGEDLPLINVDSALIEESFGQLLENAAKYSPAGSTISIDVRTAQGRVVMSVSDQGVGITPEEQQQLGRRSFRSHRHQATIPGSGLGFWIASTFVKANAGIIEVNSRGQGFGTTASIALPGSQIAARELMAFVNE